MSRTTSVLLLSTTALLLCAPPALGQRPSLTDHEARLQLLEAAVCPQLPDPRPLTCVGDCRCAVPLTFPATSVCSETVPGTFEVVSQEPYVSSCFGFCFGGSQDGCDPLGPPPVCPDGESCVDFGLGAICLLPAGDECSTAADCTAPYTSCDFVDPITTLAAGSCISDQVCESSADCPPGYSCAFREFGDDICERDTTCGGPGLCDSGNYPPTTEFLIENVGTAGSSTLATCNGLSTQYNSNDAQACITSVETALGAPCATLP